MMHDRVMVQIADGSASAAAVPGSSFRPPPRWRNGWWGEVIGVGHYVRTVKVGDRVLSARTTVRG